MKHLIKLLRHLYIRAHARYTEFYSRYLGFNCLVVDKSSFLSMSEEIFERGIYHFSATTETPKIIDGGANIGLTTIYLKRLYPKAVVTAFEPDTKIYEVLLQNIASAGCADDVTVINKGLWSTDGELSFFSEGADGGRVATPDDHERIITVPVVRLSSYMNETIDFLKLDIEGSEFEVLKEIEQKLHLVERIFIEYHSLQSEKQTLPDILSILQRAGFRYYIESTGVHSAHPLTHVSTHLGYDNQLNIFGYRTHHENPHTI